MPAETFPSTAHPFARFLGVEFDAGPPLMARLPFRPQLIGNPMVPALHGGVICALLEITALGQLGLEDTFPRPPKPVNVSVQYLRTGRPVETFARASVNRIGRTIASVEAVAWQDDPNHAIATLQAHFLLTPAEGEIADQK